MIVKKISKDSGNIYEVYNEVEIPNSSGTSTVKGLQLKETLKDGQIESQIKQLETQINFFESSLCERQEILDQINGLEEK